MTVIITDYEIEADEIVNSVAHVVSSNMSDKLMTNGHVDSKLGRVDAKSDRPDQSNESLKMDHHSSQSNDSSEQSNPKAENPATENSMVNIVTPSESDSATSTYNNAVAKRAITPSVAKVIDSSENGEDSQSSLDESKNKKIKFKLSARKKKRNMVAESDEECEGKETDASKNNETITDMEVSVNNTSKVSHENDVGEMKEENTSHDTATEEEKPLFEERKLRNSTKTKQHATTEAATLSKATTGKRNSASNRSKNDEPASSAASSVAASPSPPTTIAAVEVNKAAKSKGKKETKTPSPAAKNEKVTAPNGAIETRRSLLNRSNSTTANAVANASNGASRRSDSGKQKTVVSTTYGNSSLNGSKNKNKATSSSGSTKRARNNSQVSEGSSSGDSVDSDEETHSEQEPPPLARKVSVKKFVKH